MLVARQQVELLAKFKMNLRQQIILIVIAYPVIIYALLFVEVCLNPYWYDNSTKPEYIAMSDRFGWAVGLTLLFYFSGWGVLLTLATIAIAFYLSKRDS
jgi:hypothetical protein